LATRLQAVRAQLSAAARAAGRNEDSVTLVAVSKGQPARAVRQLARLGVSDFGESYLQEALPKVRELEALELTWHFIGRLQANKTRAVAESFSWVHSLDRLQLAQRLAAQRPHWAAPLNVCLQVKPGHDPGKGGVAMAHAAPLADSLRALPRLRLRGLMCMLPDDLGADEQLRQFRSVHALMSTLNAAGHGLDTLSMGMSGDFPLAIQAGATLVRIGTALFGARPAPRRNPGAPPPSP